MYEKVRSRIRKSEASSTTKAKLRVRAIGLSRMWLNRKESRYLAETNLRQIQEGSLEVKLIL